MILYVLGLGSPATALPAASWAAWTRPLFTYDGFTYVHSVPPLFIHQYAHAWVDFRSWRDPVPPQPDWFENAAIATRAQKRFLLSLRGEFPGYTENVWGLTASDSRKGYVAWGGPPRHPAIDGSVVPVRGGGLADAGARDRGARGARDAPALRRRRSTASTASPTPSTPRTAG